MKLKTLENKETPYIVSIVSIQLMATHLLDQNVHYTANKAGAGFIWDDKLKITNTNSATELHWSDAYCQVDTISEQSYDMKVVTKEWSIAEKKNPSYRGNRSRSSRLKIQYSNHWAKESTTWRSCQRLNIYRQAMRNLPRQIIEGRSARRNTPTFQGSHHLWHKAIFGEVMSNLGRAFILRYERRNKGMKHSLKNSRLSWESNPVLPIKSQIL